MNDLFELHAHGSLTQNHARGQAQVDAYLSKHRDAVERGNRLIDLARALPNPRGPTHNVGAGLETVPALYPALERMHAASLDVMESLLASSSKIRLAKAVVQCLDLEAMCGHVLDDVAEILQDKNKAMNSEDVDEANYEMSMALGQGMLEELLTLRYAQMLDEPTLRALGSDFPFWGRANARIQILLAGRMAPCVEQAVQDTRAPTRLSAAQEARFARLQTGLAGPGAELIHHTDNEGVDEQVKARMHCAMKSVILQEFSDAEVARLVAYQQSPHAAALRATSEHINLSTDPLVKALMAQVVEPGMPRAEKAEAGAQADSDKAFWSWLF